MPERCSGTAQGIVKRSGTTDPGRWFAYITAQTFADLIRVPVDLSNPSAPWSTSMASVAQLLRHAGYGEPLGQALAS
jgi:hypothetical protein